MFGKKSAPLTARERAQREFAYLCQAPTVAEQMPRFVTPSPYEQIIAQRLVETGDEPIDVISPPGAPTAVLVPARAYPADAAAVIERHEKLAEALRRLGLRR